MSITTQQTDNVDTTLRIETARERLGRVRDLRLMKDILEDQQPSADIADAIAVVEDSLAEAEATVVEVLTDR